MADADLTTLCTICRAVPPRYRCPRCGATYCSLGCTRKHKEWASCSGLRDVTAFVPRSRLRTPAGIDHDFNFLRRLERYRELAGKLLVDEKRLLRPDDLRLPDSRFRREWRGDELRFVPHAPAPASSSGRGRGRGGGGRGGRGGRGGFGRAPPHQRAAVGGADNDGENISKLARKTRRICREAGIEVLSVPVGLSRQRENTTTEWNKVRGHLNWQVEWLVYEDGPAARPTRVLRKALDTVPVYRAFAATMEWLIKGQEIRDLQQQDEEEEGPPRKKRRKPSCPARSSSRWARSSFTETSR